MTTETDGMLFPLPDDQLPRVYIDRQTIAQWKHEAQDAIDSFLMDKSSWFYRFDASNPGFTRAYDKNGTRGCMRVLPETHTVEFLAQAELHITMEDVVYAMRSETTQQQRAMHAQLSQHMCLDTAILKLYEGATHEDPFHRVAMVWMAISPDRTVARDYIHFDFSCSTKDAEGRSVLVQYRKTHDLRPEQLTDHTLKINRRYTHGISTFRQDHSGRVVATSLGHIVLETKFSLLVLKIIMPSVYKTTVNHHGLLEAKALQDMGLTAETLAERSSAPASMCRVCRKGFNVMRRRKWCGGCGHAICRNCTMKIAMLKRGVLLASRLPVAHARFCLRCLLHASERRIKSDLEHEQTTTTEEQQPQQELPSKIVTLVDDSSIDGLLELHREHLELKNGDSSKLSMGVRSSAATFSTMDSALEDELLIDAASAKADELALAAASVAEHAALLRQMHQEHYMGQRLG